MTSRFQHLDTVASTNQWMSERAADLELGTVVYTLNQSAGRGRLGRTWSSTPGETLAFSVLLEAFPPEIRATWVPLIAGASVVEVVHHLGVTEVLAKWPNDVLVGGAKLAGVLVEVLPDGRMVLGVGINVFSTPESLPDSGATSLLLHGVTVGDVVEDLLSPVVTSLEAAIRRGLESPAHAHDVWRDYVTPFIGTLGRVVDYQLPDGTRSTGVACALGGDGALIVTPTDGGPEVYLHSGDIFHIGRS